MGWEALLTIIMKSLTVLAWPPFSLLCPLYTSIRAMESDSRSSNQRCLAFWVLFSLSMIVEWELAVLFNWLQLQILQQNSNLYEVLLRWLPWWPHVKGMATILLLIPYFGVAPYIYKYLIEHYCTWNTCTRTLKIFSQKSAHFILDEDSKLVDVSGQTIITSQIQEEKLLVYQGRHDPAGCDLTKSNYTRPTGKKQVQKEWSCALCQISTTSENCLGAHLQGKKHKAKENELRVELPVTDSTYLLSSTQKRIKGMVLLRNLNQIANILSPVSRSKRWCEWIKPEFGWTKLNTDGSIHGETAGFGGLLRDYMGEPICAFVSKAPQGDVLFVELWAIWRGLVLSLGLGIKAIWVEADSMSVVKTINKEQPSCPKADSCLKQIWKLLRKVDEYQISHSWRETNRAADHLAKIVLGGNEGRYDPAGCDLTKSNYTRPTGKKQVQKEWSCALCQISTTSENCLGAHLQGKKHKAKENELRVELPVTDSTYLLSSTQKRIKGMVLLRNLNQIANILSPVSRSKRWCEWIKPEFGWTKLNTDGSIHGGTAGFGGLLRDYRGEPICAFVSKARQGDVFLVELWAIWRGLVLSLGLGIKAIWVEADSMSVVKTINKEQPSCPKADSCLKQIWKLLLKFDKYQISHSWRETNRAADHLAKMVLGGNDVVLWPVDFPYSLRNIIKDDAKGKKYLRR